MKVNLIVPCYNEAGNLWQVRNTFLREVGSNGEIDFRLIIVDNGSTDESSQILSSVEFSHDSISIVTVDLNIGYGHGIKKGVGHENADLYCWTHADLQTPMKDVIRIINYAQQNKKYILAGKRQTKGTQKLQSLIFDSLASICIGFRMDDINGQPKLFGHVYKDYFTNGISPDDFALDLYYFKVFKSLGCNVERSVVQFVDRVSGDAKGGQTSLLSRVRLLIKMLTMAVKVRNIKIVDY